MQRFKDIIARELARRSVRRFSDRFQIRGLVTAHYRDPFGRLVGIDSDREPNLVVDVGIDYVLANGFGGPFYIGLKDTGSPAAGWTMGSGPTELTNYTEANRPTFTENGTGADQTLSNSSSPADFTYNGTDDVYGVFLATSATKGETASVLIAAKNFTAPRSVESGFTHAITWQLVASSS